MADKSAGILAQIEAMSDTKLVSYSSQPYTGSFKKKPDLLHVLHEAIKMINLIKSQYLSF